MAPSSITWSSGRRRSIEVAGARYAAFLILYLLLTAGIYGGILLYRIMWTIRCQDAINMSHTASAFARTYSLLDVTKTTEFKTSLNSTVARVLDDKLPELISRTCVSLDVFNVYPALGWAYLGFGLCHWIAMLVIICYANASTEDTDTDGVPRRSHIRRSIASGFLTGWYVAAAVWIVVQSLVWWTSIFDFFDGIDFGSLQGVLFNALPAIGAVTSIIWPSSTSNERTDEESDLETAWKQQMMDFANITSANNTKVPGDDMYVVRKEKQAPSDEEMGMLRSVDSTA